MTTGANGYQAALSKEGGGTAADVSGRSGADLIRDVLQTEATGTDAVNAKLSGADLSQKRNDTVGTD